MFDRNTEYSFLKTPFEIINNDFKKTRKDLEKEMTQVVTSIINLKNSESITKEEAIQKLQSSNEKLTNLKRRISEEYTQQTSMYEIIKKRIHHLNMTELNQNVYLKTKINRIIIQYFYLNNKFEQSELLIKALNLDTFCSCEKQLIRKLYVIIQNLRNHDLTLLTKWCTDHKSKLVKINSPLEFKIILQMFIELIRDNKKIEAVNYIRSCSNLTVNEECQNQFEEVMGCLIFSDSLPDHPKHAKYFSSDRWNELINLFKITCFKIYRINFQSSLQRIFSIGISAVKTLCCTKESTQNKSICPICEINVNEIAKHIPYTTKTLSTLICRISNQIMNEKNPPMMLPNGQIFSKKGIQSIQKNGKIECPITLTSYDVSLVRRIFLF